MKSRIEKTEQKTPLGRNRTGIQTSPVDSRTLIEAAESTPPSSPGGSELSRPMRLSYLKESEKLGSVPPPVTPKGLVKTATEVFKGHRPTAFLDQLGARLAFERTGTRLYELLLDKHEVFGSWDEGPTRVELIRIRDEELSHVHLVHDALEQLGADPTVMTPSADLGAVASSGFVQVLGDPRVDLRQGLWAILLAELADNDAWDTLEKLARSLGFEELSERFVEATDTEAIHLSSVRGWLAACLSEEAGIQLEPPASL